MLLGLALLLTSNTDLKKINSANEISNHDKLEDHHQSCKSMPMAFKVFEICPHPTFLVLAKALRFLFAFYAALQVLFWLHKYENKVLVSNGI